MSAERHRDGRGTNAFDDEMLVVCPACSHLARSVPIAPIVLPPMQYRVYRRRLTCDHCGHARSGPCRPFRRRKGQTPVLDEHWGLPLWLQAPCCGEVLWAWNTEHLAYIEALVGARLRESKRGPGTGMRPLAGRLPGWIKSAKNRDEVLACTERLRKTLT